MPSPRLPSVGEGRRRTHQIVERFCGRGATLVVARIYARCPPRGRPQGRPDLTPRSREWEGLFRRWLRKEEFCQANFRADIVLEPTYAGEVMKDIGSDCKIPSERKLELEMASQEVIFTQRQGSLGCHERRSCQRKSAVRCDLLATPRLLYAEGDKPKRHRFVAQKSFDIVRGALS